MRTVTTVSELRSELLPYRRQGRSIGVVPTMGAFHAGHASLMRRAREECDVVVVSLFVNPKQFNDDRDLAAYPRDAARDGQLAAAEGVDYLFVPTVEEVYPRGFSTQVTVAATTDRLEGASRGHAHFDGVTTVVTKLFNMVGPDYAYFGQKDAQQVTVIRRMVRDLNLAVQVIVCPTVRDSDGLALSSRNVQLSAAERDRALSLSRALSAIAAAIQAGERDPAAARAAGLSELELDGIAPEYLELVAPGTLEPAPSLEGEVLAVIAAQVGATRLIDNTLIHAQPAQVAALGA